MKSIFDYKNYQGFLLNFFQHKRGNQARLAEYLDCRSSFLTQVIDQKVELTLDQAVKIPDFLGFNKNEKLAFMLMIQKEKISDLSGKKFIDEHIIKLNQQNSSVKERLNQIEELSDESKTQYYSSWIYGAIHILCAFSWISHIDDITKFLNIDRTTAATCVNFLMENQLISSKGNKLSIGKKQVHIGDDSKFIYNHHINWRLKTIEKLSLHQKQKLNYSSLIGISKKDVDVVHEILLKAISDINSVVQKSGEEEAYILNMDFLNL